MLDTIILCLMELNNYCYLHLFTVNNMKLHIIRFVVIGVISNRIMIV